MSNTDSAPTAGFATWQDRTLAFDVEGRPAPQGSKIKTRFGTMFEASKYVGPWRDAVARAASDAGDFIGLFMPLQKPYAVVIDFYFEKPRTSRAEHPIAPNIGDGDKLTRATWDALKVGGLIEDDRFIIRWGGSKRWCGKGETPGAVIRIIEAVQS